MLIRFHCFTQMRHAHRPNTIAAAFETVHGMAEGRSVPALQCLAEGIELPAAALDERIDQRAHEVRFVAVLDCANLAQHRRVKSRRLHRLPLSTRRPAPGTARGAMPSEIAARYVPRPPGTAGLSSSGVASHIIYTPWRRSCLWQHVKRYRI